LIRVWAWLLVCAACSATPILAPGLSVPRVDARPALIPVGDRGGADAIPLTATPINHYQLVREVSATSAALRAVVWNGDRAFAFGDGGTILERTGVGHWALAASPTQERLRGVSKGGHVSVVGDHGTWLTQEGARWVAEVSGTDEDLYAVADVGGIYGLRRDERVSFAVGAHGVMIERASDGRFSPIETRTHATLRAILYSHAGSSANHGELMDDLYIVGDGGTIVNCSLRMVPPVCIPRPSPTGESLVAIVDAIPAAATFASVQGHPLAAFVLGGDGSILGTTLGRLPPYDFGRLAGRVPPGMSSAATTRAPGGLDGAVMVGGEKVFPPMVLVGAGGRGAFFDGIHVTEFALPGVADLHDVAGVGLNVFAVGDGGTIVHGWMPEALQSAPVNAELL